MQSILNLVIVSYVRILVNNITGVIIDKTKDFWLQVAKITAEVGATVAIAYLTNKSKKNA